MTAYQVLARKWRPKTFADLVGQQHVVKALQNALDKGRLHHAYLLTGTRGVGKTTIARILAKSLNCEQAVHGEPCGVCQSCRDIDAGRFVDLLEIDAASNTGIDNIREVLENAQYAPTVGKYKVYIIDEVHMLSKSAFNAMLKTLEEPPEHVKFILATTDPHKVPITVLSRCLQFVLRNMTPQQVSAHLTHVLDVEQVAYEPSALTLLGRAAQGSMRDALSLLDQAIAMGSGGVYENDVRQMIGAVDNRYLYELLTFLMERDGEGLIAKAQEMAVNGVGFDGALNELAMLLQRLALLKTVPSALSNDDPEYERLMLLSQYFGDEQIQLYYQCAIHGKHDLPLAPDEYAGFVMTLLRMLAFAPFAAKHTPAQAKIEGTQLHNPEPPIAKKDTKDIRVEDTTAPDTLSSLPQKQFRPQDLPPPHPQEVRREAPVPVPASTPEPIINEPVAQAVQPSALSEEDTPPWEDAPVDDGYIPFDELPTTPPSALPEPPAETVVVEAEPLPETEKKTDDTEPMPEFKRENWVEIATRISSKVSAAQMVLNHLAWLDYQDGVLQLALVQEKTRNTVKKEYLDRIAHTLSELYQLPITIQTRPWQAEQNSETPTQQRERLQIEQRQHAQALLENDASAQQAIATFNAKWREDMLVLKAG